jgi:serine/threonine-protein kinase
MPDELPRTLGPYTITGPLGKGGDGRLLGAIERSRNRVVAIELLPPDLVRDAARLERFERQAEAVAQLDDPHLVRILDRRRDGDLVYLVMEYVPGSSLDEVLARRRLSLPEALRVFKAVCRGLAAAHEKGITHGALGPRQILVTDDLSAVKLAPFGISRDEPAALTEGTVSTSHLSLAALHYLAPEQVGRADATDRRSDVYSAGAVLYEMLTGRLPVGRFGLPSHLNGEVPPELDPLVLKCLAGNPGERYPTVAGLLADLDRLEDQLRLGLADELRGISRSTTRMLTRSRSVASRRGLQLAVGVALVLALAAAGACFLLAGRGGEPAAVPPGEEVAAPPATAEAPAAVR